MTEKRGMKALELWCRRVTEGYPGVKIENMTTSWRDGLAFCALIHHFRPDLIDFDRLNKSDIYKNNELAFRIAERQLGIPALLDAEDMVEYEVPDRLSILTYLSQFYQAFVSNQQGAGNSPNRTHPSKVAEMMSPTAKTAKPSKVSSGRLETCWSCRRPVFLAERLVAGGKLRHRTCFTCKRCGNQLNLVGYYETETGDFVCETCPDEEKRRDRGVSQEEVAHSIGDTQMRVEYPRDECHSNSEGESTNAVANRKWTTKQKFLDDMVDSSGGDSPASSPSKKPVPMETSLSPERTDDVNQHSTANLETLNVKIKSLLGRDFTETLSLLDHEPESFLADISEIIDNVISDAVNEVELRVYGCPEKRKKSDSSHETEIPEIKVEDESQMVVADDSISSVGVNANGVTDFEITEPETRQISSKTDEEKNQEVADRMANDKDDYPEDLNPFAGDDDEEEEKPSPAKVKPRVTPRKHVPSPASRSEQKVPVASLNPFWSDGEPTSDEEDKATIARRTPLKSSEEESPFSRQHYGSFTSLSSLGSSVSRRKKGPAPAPPANTKSLQHHPSGVQSNNQSGSAVYRSPSPSASIRSHRKSKPAPPPPPPPSSGSQTAAEHELSTGKKEKNYENKVKQNLSVSPDKSSYGKWKRKKGQAPGLPIPQRRRIAALPLPEFYRELEDLEIQQRELERQGVNLEQTIRMYEEESLEALEEADPTGKDVEGLILQLFDIVNQKNELFRRQAELMYLRRQQRLEEEHADIEYQIRCLMGRPERNKTDSDKEQEEELIRRLVEVVERRNEIIECLDMDRKREVEEDKSIHHHLEAFAGKKESETRSPEKKPTSNLKVSSSLLKLVKKKKSKKEKQEKKESSSPWKTRRDFDKDVDEAAKEEESVKSSKSKKKWFAKT